MKEIPPDLLAEFDKRKINCLETFSTLNPDIYIPTIPGAESVHSNWLFSHSVYESWLQQTSPAILCLHGKLGKSMLSSLALKNMKTSSFNPGKAIIFFFCDKLDERRRSTKDVLSSLIRQLLVQQPSLFRHALSLYDETKGCSNWTIQQLLVLFRVILCSRQQVQIMCVIDSPDICSLGYLDLCKELVGAVMTTDDTESPLKFIITSRLPLEISAPAGCFFHLDLDAEDAQKGIQGDLKCLLDIGVIDLVRRRPEFSGLEETITAKILGSEGSTFAIASLAFGELGSLNVPSTRASVREKLESLEFGSQHVYERQLQSIPSDWQAWASAVLSWLLCTLRPLTVDELALALAVKTNSKFLSAIEDHICLDMVGDLQKVFGSFISISNHEVRLVHPTAKEFLTSCTGGGGSWYDFDLEQAHEHISRICLTYLSMEEFNGADASRLPELHGHRPLSQSEWSLLTYAAQHWPTHYRQAGCLDSDIHSKVLDFVAEQAGLKFWPEVYRSATTPRGPLTWGSVMQTACELGFDELVMRLLDTTAGDVRRAEAVEWAAGAGHQHLVRRLLETITDIEELVRSPGALNMAARNGHESVVTLLLESGFSLETMTGSGEGPLTLAAENGHTTVVQILLAAGDRPDMEIEKSLALLRAAENGYYEVVRELLRAHADVQALGTGKCPPLHLAAQRGHVAAVKELLDGGADPQPKRPKLTPLHRAAQAGNLHIVKQILEFKRDIDPIDNARSTPLHYAAQLGHTNVVSRLLAGGADRTRADGANGNTPLHLAAANGHLSAVMLFLDREGDDDEDDEDCTDESNLDGNTALHLASYAGNASVVEALLAIDADVDAANSVGNKPLHLAAFGGHAATLQSLRRSGASTYSRNADGDYPGTIAFRCGHHKLATQYLDCSIRGRELSELHLHRAIRGGYPAIVRQLLQDTALDVNALDRYGWPALHWGVLEGREEEVKLLLQAGAEVDARIPDGGTPPHTAAEIGQEVIAKILLDNGANLLRIDFSGHTVLHRAYRNGHLGILKLLLYAGADSKIENLAGLIPLDMSPPGRREHVARALKQEEASGAKIYDETNVNIMDRKGRTKLFYSCVDGLEIVCKSLLDAKADPGIKDVDGRVPLDVALNPAIRTLLVQKSKCRSGRDSITPLDGAPLCTRRNAPSPFCDLCHDGLLDFYYRKSPLHFLLSTTGLTNSNRIRLLPL